MNKKKTPFSMGSCLHMRRLCFYVHLQQYDILHVALTFVTNRFDLDFPNEGTDCRV